MSIESEYLGIWCVVELAWTSQVCLTHLKALQSFEVFCRNSVSPCQLEYMLSLQKKGLWFGDCGGRSMTVSSGSSVKALRCLAQRVGSMPAQVNVVIKETELKSGDCGGKSVTVRTPCYLWSSGSSCFTQPCGVHASLSVCCHFSKWF